MEQPSAPASNPKVFSVAESRVDVAANLVERGDEIIHLEPRVMQLLVCLAERAGRVVSRGELEAEVWSGMVVGYDALTQAISKLRKALDDDPHHPRLVETVAKSGYRLMVAVQPGSSTRAVQAVEPAFDIPNTAVSTTLSSPASPRTTRAKLQRIVLMLLLPGFVIWLFLRPNPQPPVDATQPSLAVLPFSNLSGDAGWDYLSAGISEDLITTLAGHEGLVVIRQPVFNSQDETRDPASIARSLGARYLVEGSIQGDPQRLQLNVRLTDTQTNRHLWAKRYERDVDGLF
ncbi:MAG: winged helix-turn-helix domain-containing protein, partial [Chromatiaceae bacterium]|nr:winged helix-turn-helix domain-containing protein [Chromatiaceae bacterium]